MTDKIIKHKRTLAPWRCDHCKYTYYGFAGTGKIIIPEGIYLCADCEIKGLERYLCTQHRTIYNYQSKNKEHIHELAHKWIADITQSPLPKEKPYHQNVPQWVRKAIEADLMKCNGKEVYTVHSLSDGTSVKVEYDYDLVNRKGK